MNVSKKNTTQINWDEVDAVPETEYNYDDAPEISAEMFKGMTILMPDETRSYIIT
jgi:hypothetical protein